MATKKGKALKKGKKLTSKSLTTRKLARAKMARAEDLELGRAGTRQ